MSASTSRSRRRPDSLAIDQWQQLQQRLIRGGLHRDDHQIALPDLRCAAVAVPPRQQVGRAGTL